MRDAVLSMLLDNLGNFVSGEDISRQLGITRAAVWKYIRLLQSEGYLIESSTKKGYCLRQVPDILDEVLLTRGLNTSILGRNVEIHSSIGSTNARAKELALSGAREGTVVIADEQVQGRGRLGRSWVSPPGKGIWMSVILRPRLSSQQVPRITIMTAVAVANALKRSAQIDVGIKWPNDVVCGGKKLCGILTEVHAEPEVIHYAVVGIGLNVNLSFEDLPEDIRDIATSLRIEKGKEFNRADIIKSILQEMEKGYLQGLRDDGFAGLLKEYERRSVILGKRIRVIGVDGQFSGYAQGFGLDGSLMLRLDDGRVERILAGDVSLRGENGYV
ncbi:MAG: biotin--[acetyl-CoA-carboxylase] ligase [Caldicoprobacter oshimai]|uniref:Bifunctional ligase/repressor BirA n=1 Tax=Caldicoprobacter faecalis TaxID=937334 RepID=A0A1I5XIW5_9FIRM|nr:biotin--[acetyl-CoA-carboxylase] ligase [Caldicoprobacter faecalis]PZN10892.1 MAG: biotin--[acetyl-CoA-carboxylase] ligase [Caldicoprobacter oshimai]SFQ31899.1 BirA family transcriptional regulator, biotin operon repressor / biotin-[acetyl-CoA-carboxylase] ligase [Caldicoprobacter faecalis]